MRFFELETKQVRVKSQTLNPAATAATAAKDQFYDNNQRVENCSSPAAALLQPAAIEGRSPPSNGVQQNCSSVQQLPQKAAAQKMTSQSMPCQPVQQLQQLQQPTEPKKVAKPRLSDLKPDTPIDQTEGGQAVYRTPSGNVVYAPMEVATDEDMPTAVCPTCGYHRFGRLETGWQCQRCAGMSDREINAAKLTTLSLSVQWKPNVERKT